MIKLVVVLLSLNVVIFGMDRYDIAEEIRRRVSYVNR